MSKDTSEAAAAIVVIDDDESVRDALRDLFRSVGLSAVTYGSVREYVDEGGLDRDGCIVLDIRLPGESGLEFHEFLARAEIPCSVVLISAHVDVAMAVRAMQAGAIDVLTKPVREHDLLTAVQRAIGEDTHRRDGAALRKVVETRYATLTKRECQIMALVVSGLHNKQIGSKISVTEATVKLHRGQVMHKMEASSLPALVRMADLLGETTHISERTFRPRPRSSLSRHRSN